MIPRSRAERSRRGLRLVSLYTGAGGLDYGFEAVGARVCVAIEMDHDCCETIRANRDWPVIERDIQQTSSGGILDVAGLKVGQADILIGGPPCQPFSKSAYWAGGDTERLRDPRARTLHEYMRCVNDLLPAVFVLENVYGISYSGKEEGLLLLEKMTAEINRRHRTKYRPSWRVLKAADYGVPQIRERFFLIAHRDGGIFNFPEPTHGAPQDGEPRSIFSSSRLPYLTARDAIHAVKPPSREEALAVRGRWGDLLPSIPEGENYLWHTNRKGGLSLFGWRTRYWSFLLKLAKNRPSWTIQAQPGPAIGPFHWTSRMLSVREMASIQTFPRDIVFIGNRVSVQRQIGNAVPSLLGEVLAREIARQFFDMRIEGALKLTVRPRRPIPGPEPVRPVPKKYLHLVGNHPDHDEHSQRKPKRHAVQAAFELI